MYKLHIIMKPCNDSYYPGHPTGVAFEEAALAAAYCEAKNGPPPEDTEGAEGYQWATTALYVREVEVIQGGAGLAMLLAEEKKKEEDLAAKRAEMDAKLEAKRQELERAKAAEAARLAALPPEPRRALTLGEILRQKLMEGA